MSKRGNRIKKIKLAETKITKPSVQPLDYPIFCFKHLVLNSGSDYKFYYDFIIRLNKISQLDWNKVNKSHRHSFGTEKIPVKQIKPSLPLIVSPDVKELLVFRANGDNRPFLGLRNGNVFHIVFIEEKFGDVYNHG